MLRDVFLSNTARYEKRENAKMNVLHISRARMTGLNMSQTASGKIIPGVSTHLNSMLKFEKKKFFVFSVEILIVLY